jgi:hypothetical protein
MNLGGINPISLPIKDSVMAPVDMPDLVGSYQAARAQALDLKTKEALIQKTMAETNLKNTEAEISADEAKIKMGLSLFTDLIKEKQYEAAGKLYSNLRKNPTVAQALEKRGISNLELNLTPELKSIETVDEQGNAVLNLINQNTKKVEGVVPLKSKPASILVAEKNLQAEQARLGRTDARQDKKDAKEDRQRTDDVIRQDKDAFMSSDMVKRNIEVTNQLNLVKTLGKDALRNTSSSGQLSTAFAKILQSGILTDQDVQNALADKSLLGKFKTATEMLVAGKLPPEDVVSYLNTAKVIEQAIRKTNENQYNSFVNDSRTRLVNQGLSDKGLEDQFKLIRTSLGISPTKSAIKAELERRKKAAK